ncbi:MAG: hypothetical protein AAF658_06855 [Myxococcota bacterium]
MAGPVDEERSGGDPSESESQESPRAEWRDQLDREVEDLKQVRDELRVKAHLAKADIKDALDQLENRWPEVEASLKRFEGQAARALDDFGDAARSLIRELRDGYQRVKKDL